MHDSEHAVTVLHIVDNDAKTVYVDDVAEQPFLLRHLFIDAVKVLLAADDIALDALLGERCTKTIGKPLDHVPLAAPAAAQGFFENAVTKRVQVLKAQALQFDLEPIDAQAVGDGRIDIQGLSGDSGALFGRHGAEGSHIVQPIGQLDENDAYVLDHGQHHLAKAFGLRLGARTELDLVELADAVDEPGDLRAKLGLDVVESGTGILDNVVQDSGGYRLRVEAHVGKRLRHRDRVRDVRLARLACLPCMRRGAKFIGLENRLDLLVGQVILQRRHQLAHAMVAFPVAR